MQKLIANLGVCCILGMVREEQGPHFHKENFLIKVLCKLFKYSLRQSKNHITNQDNKGIQRKYRRPLTRDYTTFDPESPSPPGK